MAEEASAGMESLIRRRGEVEALEGKVRRVEECLARSKVEDV